MRYSADKAGSSKGQIMYGLEGDPKCLNTKDLRPDEEARPRTLLVADFFHLPQSRAEMSRKMGPGTAESCRRIVGTELWGRGPVGSGSSGYAHGRDRTANDRRPHLPPFSPELVNIH